MWPEIISTHVTELREKSCPHWDDERDKEVSKVVWNVPECILILKILSDTFQNSKKSCFTITISKLL